MLTLLIASLGCDEATEALHFELDVSAQSDVRQVELEVRPGSCDEPAEAPALHSARYRVERGRATRVSRSADRGLPEGRYAAVAFGADVACRWVAQGCADFSLPRRRADVRIELARHEPPPCRGAACGERICTPLDGQGPDPGDGDAGADARGPAPETYDCSAAPDCAALNRLPCGEGTAGQCGPCEASFEAPEGAGPGALCCPLGEFTPQGECRRTCEDAPPCATLHREACSLFGPPNTCGDCADPNGEGWSGLEGKPDTHCCLPWQAITASGCLDCGPHEVLNEPRTRCCDTSDEGSILPVCKDGSSFVVTYDADCTPHYSCDDNCDEAPPAFCEGLHRAPCSASGSRDTCGACEPGHYNRSRAKGAGNDLCCPFGLFNNDGSCARGCDKAPAEHCDTLKREACSLTGLTPNTCGACEAGHISPDGDPHARCVPCEGGLVPDSSRRECCDPFTVDPPEDGAVCLDGNTPQPKFGPGCVVTEWVCKPYFNPPADPTPGGAP